MGRKKDGDVRPSTSLGTGGGGAGDRDVGGGAHGDLCPFCGSAVVGEVAARIGPSRERMLQVGRTEGRKLFGKARKDVFLQWFALTGNLEVAAERAEVCRQTVSKHRLKDPEFAAAYEQAIELGVPDLKARLLLYVKGRPKLDAAGKQEPPDDSNFDPQLAIQILREQGRMMSGGGSGPSTGSGLGRPRKAGRAPKVATNEEVRAALTKALRAYRKRAEAGRGLKEAPPRAAPDRVADTRSPSPGNPGEDL